MSRAVDNRIVKMTFDNSQFEKGAQATSTTLGKLKAALNMDNAKNAFGGLQDAVSKVDLSKLESAATTVTDRFSNLGVIGMTALMNITNKAVDAGLALTKSLTIDPVKQGFDEYELKMGSIQTIMASTGAPLAEVNERLEELNLYADKTIYSFSDMTSNIGKFTNAGVKLDDAVAAIKGVSNVAAVSGANAEEASRSMYNFAQALSAGHVKLIDWISIERANMATVEFKTQLMESAVAAGTLAKRADGMYTVLSKDASGKKMKQAISATDNFNESLSFQWMTTDALVKTLGDYADETTMIGKKAFSAAQDVKTFSQLIGTLQEAVGSGWGRTFEAIFGNFNEAKELFTGISNVLGTLIGNSFDARNDMLESWKALGGRTKLLEGLKNIWDTFYGIINAVGTAFRNVFPRKTGEQLVATTDKFLKLTEAFKMGEGTADNLRKTFQVLFTVLKYVFGAAGIVVNVFVQLAAFVLPKLGTALLFITGTISGVIIWLENFIRTNILTQAAIQITSDAITQIVNAWNILKDAVKSFTAPYLEVVNEQFTAFTAGMSMNIPIMEWAATAFAWVAEKMSIGMTILSDAFNKAGAKAITGLRVFSAGFHKAYEFMKPFFDTFVEWTKKFVSAITPMTVGLVAGGGAIYWVGKQIDKFIKMISGIGKFTDNIVDALTSVKETLETYQQDLKAAMLRKIAMAVALLVGSIVMLTYVDPGKLAGATAAVALMMQRLTATMKKMDKIKFSASGMIGAKKAIANMILLSGAVILLASAVKKMGDLEPVKLAAATAAVEVMLFSLVFLMKKIDKSGVNVTATKTAGSMVILSGAIVVLAVAVKMLGGMDYESMAKGLGSMLIILTALSVFLAKTDMDKVSAKAKGLLSLAFAVQSMAKAVSILGALDVKTLIKGLGSVGVLLVMLSLFVNSMGATTNFDKVGVGILLISASMIVMAGALRLLGSMDLITMGKGMLAFGAILVIFAQSMNMLPNGEIAKAGATILALSVAMGLLAVSMKIIGTMSLWDIAKSIVGIGGALAVLTIAVGALEKSKGGVLALVALSMAIGILVPSIVILSSLSLGAVAVGIGAIAAILAVLIIASKGMAVGAAGVALFGAALIVLGAGAAAVGGGLMIAATGITAFGASTIAGFATMTKALEFVLNILDDVVVAVMNAFLVFTQEFIKIAPTLIHALTVLVNGLLQVIINAMPKFVEACTVLINGLLQVIINVSPKVAEAFVALINLILDVLIQAMPKLGETIGVFLTVILNGIITYTPLITQAFVVLVTSLITGIRDIVVQSQQPIIDIITAFIDTIIITLQENVPKMAGAFIELIIGILDNIAAWMPDFINAGANLIISFITGISTELPRVIDAAFKSIIAFLNGLADAIENNSADLAAAGIRLVKAVIKGIFNSLGQIWDQGPVIISELLGGLGTMGSNLVSKGGELLTSVKDGVTSGIGSMWDIGTNIVQGMIDGIGSMMGNLGNKLKNGISSAVDGVKNFLGIHSPSRLFKGFGVNTIEGMIIGTQSMTKKLSSGMKNVISKAVDTSVAVMDGLKDALNDTDFTDPVVVPVMDLTDFNRSMDEMEARARGGQKLNVSASSDRVSQAGVTRTLNPVPTAPQQQQAPGKSETNITFNQTNNSPKELDTLSTYRNTRRQLNQLKNLKGVG